MTLTLRSAALALAVAAGALTAGAPEARAQAAPPVIPVAAPRVQTVSDTLDVIGNAQSIEQVQLVARVPGYLEKIHFEDGAIVRKGDLLFTIQQDQYKAQLQQAKAQLQAATVARDHAKLETGRFTALLKQHATSQVEVDHWVFQQKTAEANILGAEAQVAIAQLNLGYTEVRAPFDGQMGRHLIDIGNLVGATSQSAVLAQINRLDPIYVVANISSQQALQIRANLDQRRLTLDELHKVAIEVALSDETGYPHKGTLQYVAPTIDPSTGTLYLRGLVPNPARTLLPGVFVKIRLPMGKVVQNALLVPQVALQEDQGGRFVLIVNASNVVEKRYVKLGQIVGAQQEILGGIDSASHVVVGELWRVTAGQTVTPKLTGAP